MQPEIPVAVLDPADGGLSVLVNFGVLAGRPATQAELEELGRTLVPEFGGVSVVAEERLEVGEHSEAELHQVRVELEQPALDTELRKRLLETTEQWARACALERHAAVTDVEP